MQIRPLPEQIAITITQSLSGSISLVGSATIIYRLFRSKTKLASPFTRLLFCLCAGDIILSSTFIASTMPSPPTESVWGSIGTVTTCEIQGFLSTFAVLIVSFYNAALCAYYLCVIKYNISDSLFSERVEPYLHFISWVWSLSVTLCLLLYENYNPSDTVCWAGPYPSDCISNPEVDCIRGDDAIILRNILLPIPIFFVFVSYLTMLVIIWCSVKRQENRMNQYRFQSQMELRNEDENERTFLSFVRSCCTKRRIREGRVRRTKLKEIEIQAYLYFASFMLTFGTLTIVRILDPDKGIGETPFLALIIGRIFFPLQGLFNVLVYMRPEVSSVLRQNPNISYPRAFIVAMKTFDVDRRRKGRREVRRSSRLVSSIGVLVTTNGRRRAPIFSSSFRRLSFLTRSRSRMNQESTELNDAGSNPLGDIRNPLERVDLVDEIPEVNVPLGLVLVELNESSIEQSPFNNFVTRS